MEYYASSEGQPSSYNIGQGGMGAPMLDPSGSGPQGQEEWPRDEGGGGGAGLAGRSGPAGLEQAFFQISLQESAESEFPVRPGEPDCSHYVRTGTCAFGKTCRFNHPANRKQARGMVGPRGAGGGAAGGPGALGGFANNKPIDYPERPGQPDCQYYLKTGTCKFGATCKYHHPRDQAGTAGRVTLNVTGYPLRPAEKECAYYMRTGQCKYGTTCKFHHPQLPLGSMPGSPGFGGSPSSPSPQMQGMPWPIPRGPFLPGPRMQGPGGYAPMVLPPPQGVMPLQGWSFQNPMAPITSDPASGQLLGSPGFMFGPPSDPSGMVGAFNAFASSPLGVPGLQAGQGASQQKDHTFPERPGQPECQYYLKTGDCKYGMTCRYHHPKDRAVPLPTAVLSLMGLPLRPGAQPCPFYLRHGICKFGPTCKFDHPIRGTQFHPEMPLAPYPLPPHLAPPLSASNLETEATDSQETGQYGDAPEGASQESQQ